MLLKDNFLRLTSLGLSRANFILTRNLFTNTEHLATKKARLLFLRRCSENSVFPKTINNIKLPSQLDAKSTTAIKLILKKSERQLKKEITTHYLALRDLNSDIAARLEPTVTSKVYKERYTVYNNTSKLHSVRLNATFNNLIDHRSRLTEKDHTTDVNPHKIPSTDLVTDLTGNLEKKEIDLLSKGPKFSLAPKVDKKSVAQLNVAFYRLANQLRWQSALNKTRQEDTQEPYIKYPKSTSISRPENYDGEVTVFIKQSQKMSVMLLLVANLAIFGRGIADQQGLKF
ncbi:hypothetical protein AC249_AIPGENE359 [Exaiptasia diaphana]|nr:hypothetical protein AC249_AIPGENE359 [Exaiptasia diaphana]